MTQAEALAEAQRRWGQGGFVDARIRLGYGCRENVECVVYTVGDSRDVYQAANERQAEIDGCEEYPMGQGDSWEAAFADADRRDTGRDG